MPRPKKSNREDGRYELKKTVYVSALGKRVRKSFYGHNEADARRKYEAFLREEEAQAVKRKATPFAEWVETWLEDYKRPNVKPSTFSTTYELPCRKHILPHFGEKILQEIRPIDVRQFLVERASLSSSYINKIVLCLNGIFETAIDNDLLSKNPCRNMRQKSTVERRKKRYYTASLVERFCRSTANYALAVHILLRMGLRSSELCALKWDSVHLGKGELIVKEARTIQNGAPTDGPPKSKTSVRRLPIPPDLLARLREEKARASSPYVVTINGHPSRPDHFNERELEVFYNAEGIPLDKRLSAHELRHTCGTMLYQSTRDIYHVSRFLGHSDVSITARVYVHDAITDEAVDLP